MSGEGSRGWLRKTGLLVITGLIQSASIAGVGVATDFIPPVTFTVLRVGIASLALAALLLVLRPAFRWRWRMAGDVALLGLLLVAVPFLALAVAVLFVPTGLAAALYQMAPVFTVILASFLLPAERLTPSRALGAIVAVAGAVILLVAGTTTGAAGTQPLTGAVIIILGSTSVAAGLVYARLRVPRVNTLVLAAGQVFAAFGLLVPGALLVEGLPTPGAYPLSAWLATLVASLGTPVVGYWLVYYIVERYSASLAGFTGITTPLFSAAIGVTLLGEVFTLPMAAGALLIVAGVWVISRTY